MIEAKLAELVACLALEDRGDGVVRGTNFDIGYHRVFGGQILAQMITAASAAIPDKTVKSIAVAFPREGNSDLPMDYRVTVHQAGRTFATADVVGFQVDPSSGAERTVAVALVSMHIDEEGPHQSAWPPPLGRPGDAPARQLDLIPWDIRVVGDVDLHDRAAGPGIFEWWMRAAHLADAVPADERPRSVDQALVAHATDLTVIGTALRPIDGLSEADSMTKITTAVTTHSLWFHQPFRLDDWLLVTQEGPVVAHGRAFGRGDVFQGQELVASFAQESMIREIREQ